MRSPTLGRIVRTFRRAVAAFGLLVVLPAVAAAECGRPEACALANDDSEIFIGRAVAAPGGDPLASRVRVLRSFRGTARGTITVEVWSTGEYTTPVELAVGRDYLFYVYKSVERGVVSRSTPRNCATWLPLSEVDAGELAYLSQLSSRAVDARITGSVHQGSPFSNEPLAGARVLLSGSAATTVTSATGAFEFVGLPPGTYDIAVEVPPGVQLMASDGPIEMVAHGCATALLWTEPDTVVRGRVVLPERRSAANVAVTAMTPAGTSVKTGYVDDQGRYEILGLPPGEYVLGINAQGFPPREGFPFPPTFAPGTTDRQAAVRIRVGVPADLADVNIVVPAPAPRVALTVRATDPEGRPVAGAFVSVSTNGRFEIPLGQTDGRGLRRVEIYIGALQHLLVSTKTGCASPVAIGPAAPSAEIDVTLTREGCRDTFNMSQLAELRAKTDAMFGTLPVRVTFPDGRGAYRAHISLFSRPPRFYSSFETDRDGRFDVAIPLEQRFDVRANFDEGPVHCTSGGVWVNTERGIRWQARVGLESEPVWEAIGPSSGELVLRLEGPACTPPAPQP